MLEHREQLKKYNIEQIQKNDNNLYNKNAIRIIKLNEQ